MFSNVQFSNKPLESSSLSKGFRNNEVGTGFEPVQRGFADRSLTIRATDQVENPGNDPGSANFQSAAYTMFANSPCINELMSI